MNKVNLKFANDTQLTILKNGKPEVYFFKNNEGLNNVSIIAESNGFLTVIDCEGWVCQIEETNAILTK